MENILTTPIPKHAENDSILSANYRDFLHSFQLFRERGFRVANDINHKANIKSIHDAQLFLAETHALIMKGMVSPDAVKMPECLSGVEMEHVPFDIHFNAVLRNLEGKSANYIIVHEDFDEKKYLNPGEKPMLSCLGMVKKDFVSFSKNILHKKKEPVFEKVVFVDQLNEEGKKELFGRKNFVLTDIGPVAMNESVAVKKNVNKILTEMGHLFGRFVDKGKLLNPMLHGFSERNKKRLEVTKNFSEIYSVASMANTGLAKIHAMASHEKLFRREKTFGKVLGWTSCFALGIAASHMSSKGLHVPDIEGTKTLVEHVFQNWTGVAHAVKNLMDNLGTNFHQFMASLHPNIERTVNSDILRDAPHKAQSVVGIVQEPAVHKEIDHHVPSVHNESVKKETTVEHSTIHHVHHAEKVQEPAKHEDPVKKAEDVLFRQNVDTLKDAQKNYGLDGRQRDDMIEMAADILTKNPDVHFSDWPYGGGKIEAISEDRSFMFVKDYVDPHRVYVFPIDGEHRGQLSVGQDIQFMRTERWEYGNMYDYKVNVPGAPMEQDYGKFLELCSAKNDAAENMMRVTGGEVGPLEATTLANHIFSKDPDAVIRYDPENVPGDMIHGKLVTVGTQYSFIKTQDHQYVMVHTPQIDRSLVGKNVEFAKNSETVVPDFERTIDRS